MEAQEAWSIPPWPGTAHSLSTGRCSVHLSVCSHLPNPPGDNFGCWPSGGHGAAQLSPSAQQHPWVPPRRERNRPMPNSHAGSCPGPSVLPKDAGGQGQQKPVQAVVQAAAQAALPSLPHQACATPPWESPDSTAPAVIATGTSTASALLAAAGVKPLAPLSSPFLADGAWHPWGLFGICCNPIDFSDHQKLPAQAEGAAPCCICTFTARRDSPEITSPPAWP